MMDFVTTIAATAPELTNWIGKLINMLYEAIGGSFGWTVVVFALVLKILMSPFDIWQKLAQRKQSRGTMLIQPQLAKLQKQYANKPDILKQKQYELYKQNKLGAGSMLGMCLPMILTMVIFIVIFGGFNAMVRYQNEMMVYNMAMAYNESLLLGNPLSADQLVALYQPEQWLWVKNVFMPDTWTTVVPTLEQYLGTGIGQIGGSKPEIVNWADWYNTLFNPAVQAFNKQSFWQVSRWNGYFILPIVSIVLSIFSSKAMQASTTMPTGTPEQQKTSKGTQKFMLIFMPIMMGVFAMFYSAAFCIYMIIGSLFSTVFGVTFNLINKKKDKVFKEQLELESLRR